MLYNHDGLFIRWLQINCWLILRHRLIVIGVLYPPVLPASAYAGLMSILLAVVGA